MSWEEYAIKGAVGLVVFGVLFLLASLRWSENDENDPNDDQANDPGLD